ncbi:mechanosensitive ion channel family protein [Myxococcota bacterium]|nr:mechanosensitive ion channel family protein [Myxococcota bacterium]
MTPWGGILEEAIVDQSLPIFLGLVITAALVGAFALGERRRLRAVVFAFVMHLALVLPAGLLRAAESDFHPEARFAALVFAALSVVLMTGILLFDVFLPILRASTPRILRDVIMAVASAVSILALASRLGFNLSGLIATSAVVTAVIGFSLQDTLGNIMGGLALQLDNSVKVGDWIKVKSGSDGVSGRVIEIRWRHTAVETRNWETLIIPNSILMKGEVMILGRRQGQPLQWRRWVYFNIDFRFQPSDVIAAVEQSLLNAPIEGVALEPQPNCILMGLEESYARYAVRYWLTDLARDDPTDSIVRTRVYFALQRSRIPLSMPAHAIFVTEDNSKRKEKKARADLDRRFHAISQVDLFQSLSEPERRRIAESLLYAPFTRGEVVTKQGAEAHWLYVLVEGEVSVRVTASTGLEREVSRLRAPAVFGEMSLMTGERRTATIVALADVECYRLDREAFRAVLQQRPDVAEHVAELLAARRTTLLAAQEDLDQEARTRRIAHEKGNILEAIQAFFGLADDDRR